MSTHDYIIADAAGSAFLADLNLAVKALVSNNSSATEPTTMYAHMWWADTTANILKKRNAANTGWISYFTLSTGALLGQGLGTPASGVLTNCTGTAAGLSIGGNATTATTATNVTGSSVVSGAISSSSPTAGIGYATGAGGAVSIAYGGAGTINNVCGRITIPSATFTSGTFGTIGVSNSSVDANDVVSYNFGNLGLGNSSMCLVNCITVSTGGSFSFTIFPQATFTGSMYIDFVVHKSVSA